MTPDAEEEERRDDAAFEKLGFVAAGLAVTILGAIAVSWVGKAAKAREAEALEAIPDLLAWWPAATDSGGGGLGFLTGLAILSPFILFVLTFPSRWNGITGWERPLAPAVRWPLLGAAALLAAALIGVNAASAGRDLGVATLTGVTWLHDGQPQGEVRWAQAQRVEIRCWDETLTYDVVFADGQTAPLGDGAREDIGHWIDRLTLVDQTLRAYGVERAREGEETCLRRYDEGLIPSERERFRAVVAG